MSGVPGQARPGSVVPGIVQKESPAEYARAFRAARPEKYAEYKRRAALRNKALVILGRRYGRELAQIMAELEAAEQGEPS